MSASPRRPEPPSALQGPGAAAGERLEGPSVALPAATARELARLGVEVLDDPDALAEAGRDWWPISLAWAARGLVARRPAAVVRPTSTAEVAGTLAAASAGGVPVTPAAGRSGVCGGTVPAAGGLLLDLTGLSGLVALDEGSLLCDVRAGTFGPDLEDAVASVGQGYTVGHFPQSFDISTVGGWLACRGAGQHSTRYGKVEDLVAGLEVVLADGTVVDTRHEAPRSATGPSLTQLFVGNEGTLGVITEARLRLRPRPACREVAAFAFASFAAGLEACRRLLRRGATPAVLRLYDEAETERHFPGTSDCALIVLDEGDPAIVSATMTLVDEEAASARPLDDAVVARWLEHRNDVSALAPLWQAGIVVDTAEVAGPWSKLPALADAVRTALSAMEGTLVASVHESHAYLDGACLYFTFAGRQEGGPEGGDLGWMEAYYTAAWDALTAVVESHGCAITHHHGIGLNRARFLPGALGAGHRVLGALKKALDPAGILRPGGLGLPSPFEPPGWP